MKKSTSPDARPAYSSQHGRLCPSCGRPVGECTCKHGSQSAKSDGIVRIRREVKGRRGKIVTTITGVPLHGEAMLELAASLKKHCGAGGSVKDSVIIIQGDHRDVLVPELEKKGYTVKRAGG